MSDIAPEDRGQSFFWVFMFPTPLLFFVCWGGFGAGAFRLGLTPHSWVRPFQAWLFPSPDFLSLLSATFGLLFFVWMSPENEIALSDRDPHPGVVQWPVEVAVGGHDVLPIDV